MGLIQSQTKSKACAISTGALAGTIGFVKLNSSIVVAGKAGTAIILGGSGAIVGALVGYAIYSGVSYLAVRYEKESQQLIPIQDASNSNFVAFTKEELDKILSLSSKQYKRLIKDYTCPLSGQLIRQCVSLSCSHVFQKQKIYEYIKQKGCCPTCHMPATHKDMRKDRNFETTIEYIDRKNTKILKQFLENHQKEQNNSKQKGQEAIEQTPIEKLK